MKKTINNGEINFLGKNYKLINPLAKNLILKNNRTLLETGLNESANNFKKLLKDIDSIWKKELKLQIRKKPYRNWVKSTIKRGLHEIKRAQKIIKGDKNFYYNKKLLECIDMALLSVGFAQRFFDYNKTSSIFFEKKFRDHIIPLKEIKKGDVILSYKTTDYLKSHILSKLIYHATFSKITHSELVSENKKGEIKILACRPETKGVREIIYKLRQGEIAFVFEPNIDGTKKKELSKKIDEFIELSKKHPSEYKFSEIKCWTACFLGLLYTRGILFGSNNFIFPNPIHKKGEYFCSELIEEIFCSLGIYLTTRSNCRGTVGPSEIFHSPYLQYKGIFCSLLSETDIGEKLEF